MRITLCFVLLFISSLSYANSQIEQKLNFVKAIYSQIQTQPEINYRTAFRPLLSRNILLLESLRDDKWNMLRDTETREWYYELNCEAFLPIIPSDGGIEQDFLDNGVIYSVKENEIINATFTNIGEKYSIDFILQPDQNGFYIDDLIVNGDSYVEQLKECQTSFESNEYNNLLDHKNR